MSSEFLLSQFVWLSNYHKSMTMQVNAEYWICGSRLGGWLSPCWLLVGCLWMVQIWEKDWSVIHAVVLSKMPPEDPAPWECYTTSFCWTCSGTIDWSFKPGHWISSREWNDIGNSPVRTHRNRNWPWILNMVMFHSYFKLPEEST